MNTQLPVKYRPDSHFYSIGDIFELPNSSIGVLAQVSSRSVCMIVLAADCNRWVDPITVDNIHKITEKELEEITYGDTCIRLGRLV